MRIGIIHRAIGSLAGVVVVFGLLCGATGTAHGQGPTITPASGIQASGQQYQPYTLNLSASNGSGNYSWSIVSQSNGLNLSLTSTTGANTSLSGIPTQQDTDNGLTITVQLADLNAESSSQATYTIPVAAGHPCSLQIQLPMY